MSVIGAVISAEEVAGVLAGLDCAAAAAGVVTSMPCVFHIRAQQA